MNLITRRKFECLVGSAAFCGGLSPLASRISPAEEPDEAIVDEPSPPRLNDLRLQPIDLRDSIRMAVQHICRGAVDERRGYLPLLQFRLIDAPPFALHDYWASPHMVGRFLNALATSASVVDEPIDDKVVAGLRDLLFESLNHPSGFAIDKFPNPSGKRTASMHNCREVLLGLTDLAVWRRDEESLQRAKQFIRTIELATRKDGGFPAGTLSDSGWDNSPSEDFAPMHSGRLIGALLSYFRATQDALAIDLAIRFADHNLAKAFAPDGQLTPQAGNHLHSIEGTVTGIIDLAVTINDRSYLETGKRIYDVGLRPWRSSFGWAREMRVERPGRISKGEANNTGDLIQSALLLGQCGYREYFADAERFIRNGLLASQIVNTQWISEPDGRPDTPERIYTDVRKRIKGAFAFTTPNSYHSYNTDLVGGAVQSLCAAWKAILTRDQAGWRANLLFSRDSEAFSFRSLLPQLGRLEITVRQAEPLWVRLPPWLAKESMQVRINEKSVAANIQRDQLFLHTLQAGDQVEITFDQASTHITENVSGCREPFSVEWLGDTVMSLTPQGHTARLY